MVKSLLVSIGVTFGILVLFVGTVLSLLNLQGRLNPKGVKGTPLEPFFQEQERKQEKAEKKVEEKESLPKKDAKREEKKYSREMEKGIEEKDTGQKAETLAPTTFATLSDVTKEDINAMASSLMKRELHLKTLEHVLRKKEEDLRLREQDVEDRQKTVRRLMGDLDRERRKIEQAYEKFKHEKVELKKDEKKNIKRLANVISEMRPEDAAKTLSGWMPEGEKKIVKILVAMDPSAAAKVLEYIPQELSQRLFDLMTRYREEKGK